MSPPRRATTVRRQAHRTEERGKGPIHVAISGSCGRMGRTIATLALQDPVFSIRSPLEAPGHESVGRDFGAVLGRPTELGVDVMDDAREAINRSDVVIEFTTPEVTIAHARLARQFRKPMVIGTTGLSAAQHQVLRAVAEDIALVVSPNMSVGVNLLYALAQEAAVQLGPSYDVEVIEAHHRHKKDAPSGTAKQLAERLAAARRQPVSAIPVHALRAGDIVGDHTVMFAGPAERLELTHRAHSRDVFARGALRAAQFLIRQGPGLYEMTDVLQGAAARPPARTPDR